MLKINEIFFSIQGESSWAGTPTVFVRTTGCNLRCTYCDTTYSYYEGAEMSAEQILAKISSFESKYVCMTGGEPLLQKESFELIRRLCEKSYHVSVETSGNRDISAVDSRAKVVLDVKTPNSGAKDSFFLGNLSAAQGRLCAPEFKFVICSENDLDWAESFCRQHEIFEKFVVLYSPSFGTIEPQWLAEKILQKKSPARLQLQLHKYIWLPETRGV